jgi:hypothetical protein
MAALSQARAKVDLTRLPAPPALAKKIDLGRTAAIPAAVGAARLPHPEPDAAAVAGFAVHGADALERLLVDPKMSEQGHSYGATPRIGNSTDSGASRVRIGSAQNLPPRRFYEAFRE